MLDVGCGEGHAVAFFQRNGVHAHGIEGLMLNVQRGVVPIAHHDILAGPYTMPVDFVWSCEVAEHILPERVQNYIATLSNAPIVAMTHAVPGQGGHHHVNCQPAEYWIDMMSVAGYQLFSKNDAMRKLAAQEVVPTYFQNTGMVFLRR